MLLRLKQIKVDEDKKTFDNMISTSHDTINNIILTMNNIINNHTEFLQFIENINMYEIYRWEALKTEYNNIKKEFNKAKKLYRNMSEFYGNIITYYTEEMITKNNNIMKTIGSLNENMIYTFIQLKKIHKNVYSKSKYHIKNTNIIKVNDINDINKDIIKDLYQLYNDMKINNKNIASIKTRKFLCESKNL